jgi:hypothetical protein
MKLTRSGVLKCLHDGVRFDHKEHSWETQSSDVYLYKSTEVISKEEVVVNDHAMRDNKRKID